MNPIVSGLVVLRDKEGYQEQQEVRVDGRWSLRYQSTNLSPGQQSLLLNIFLQNRTLLKCFQFVPNSHKPYCGSLQPKCWLTQYPFLQTCEHGSIMSPCSMQEPYVQKYMNIWNSSWQPKQILMYTSARSIWIFKTKWLNLLNLITLQAVFYFLT